MTAYRNPKEYTDDHLIQVTLNTVQKEREITSLVIKYLDEIDQRKLYLERGFSSLFDFCIKKLGYSESAAQRRISSMRFIRDLGSRESSTVKDIEGKIKSGKITLSHLTLAQKAIRFNESQSKTRTKQSEKLTLLQKIEGCTYRESEKRIAEFTGASIPTREVVTLGKEGNIRLSLNIDQETLELIQEFKELYAHQNPTGDTAKALKLALKISIEKKNPLKKKSTLPQKSIKLKTSKLKTNSALVKPLEITVGAGIKKPYPKNRVYIHRSSVRFIWKRSHGSCEWLDLKSKKRCGSKYMLEVDHIKPVSRGGTYEISNLQLLCRNHNAYKSNKIILQ